MQWQKPFTQLERMRQWVYEAEEILAAQWLAEDELSNEKVGTRFDEWCKGLKQLAQGGGLSEVEAGCLSHFLKITASLRPHLIQCYSLSGLPRTNNEMEGFIRKLKTRYRRVSGRKNWSSYLLRYGRSVAYYEYLAQSELSETEVAQILGRVDRQGWREVRILDRREAEEQLKKTRFRRDPVKFLSTLAERWEQSLVGT